MRAKAYWTVFPLLVSACGWLTGCTSNAMFPDSEAVVTKSVDVTGGALHGFAHGGQQPIAGAHIYLLAAGTTGYGSAATSLLTSASVGGYTTQQDTSGFYFATTDAAGKFQIDSSCTAGQQVYLASVGGNPGSGANTAANEIALLGQCPQTGSFESSLSGAYISEISTIVAAFSASAFAVDTFHIGSPTSTALQKTGIANAFANAANMLDVQDINELARTQTITGNGVVPQAKIHTLANIIASCVNSASPSSPSCTTLFNNTLSAGTSGTTPTDVTTAAINIAHNPWARGNRLFALQTQSAPFPTTITAAPNDFALAISYSNGALGANPALAIDGSGNVFNLVSGSAAITKLSPLGAVLSGSGGYAIGGGMTDARGLALDTGNNVFVLGKASSGTTPIALGVRMTNTGSYTNTYTEPALGTTHPPAASTNLIVDAAGNFYFSGVKTTTSASTICCTMKVNLVNNTETELDSGTATPGTNFLAVSQNAVWTTANSSALSLTTTASSSVTGGGLNAATGVALDSSGNAWVVNSGNNSLSEFNSAGTAITGSTGFTGGALSTPKAIAVDGLGTVWVTNSRGNFGLSQFSSTGNAVGSGYASKQLTNAGALAIDPSGNIWMADASSTTLLQFIGLAAPVVTPGSVAIGAGTLGMRP